MPPTWPATSPASARTSGEGATTDAYRLIINADDFGYTRGVTDGILEAHHAGVVSSTTMLTNMPAFDDAVRAMRDGNATLGVGVHINLVQGRPLARVRTLVDARTGSFYALPALVARALAGRIDPDEVGAECEAQIAALRAAGVDITHVDSHMHTHAIPALWHPISSAAVRAGIHAMRWPAESFRNTPFQPSRLATNVLVSLSWASIRRTASPLRYPDHFMGISLQGGRDVERNLLRTFDNLAPGTTELMMHPGHSDAELASMDNYTWQRENELQALTSPAVRDRLARGDIELVDFGSLR
jgi:predicted glycoside hydrolase/deacetylase ChbG (UPF0249 family)